MCPHLYFVESSLVVNTVPGFWFKYLIAPSVFLLLGRKAMTNLDSILKSRDIICQQKSVQSRLWFFQWSCMDVRVGPQRRLSTEESMLLNCGVGEDS